MIEQAKLNGGGERWRSLARYWTLCKVSFQERMEYRWNTLFYLGVSLLPSLVSIYLWSAVFGGNNNPAAVRHITTYYLVAGFIGWRIADFHWQTMWEIRDGRMATDLLRPISYPAKLFWYEVGGRTWSTLLTTPAFVVLAFALGDNFEGPSNGLTWLLTFVAFGVAFVLNFFMTAALGLVTIWQNQPEGFFSLWGAMARGLGGVVVPLSLLPGGIGDWLQWLPFAYIYGLPIRIFQGLSAAQIWQSFGVQLVWLIVAVLVFRWAWRKAVRRYEVFEG